MSFVAARVTRTRLAPGRKTRTTTPLAPSSCIPRNEKGSPWVAATMREALSSTCFGIMLLFSQLLRAGLQVSRDLAFGIPRATHPREHEKERARRRLRYVR